MQELEQCQMLNAVESKDIDNRPRNPVGNSKVRNYRLSACNLKTC